MTLVDTSVWIERDRRRGSVADNRLRALLESDEDVFVTEPIEMELLAGTGDRLALRRLLLGVESIAFDSSTDFSAAARIHAACRSAGSTPRGMVDCMIAAVALRAGVPLLARDRDFGRIADVTGLDLVGI